MTKKKDEQVTQQGQSTESPNSANQDRNHNPPWLTTRRAILAGAISALVTLVSRESYLLLEKRGETRTRSTRALNKTAVPMDKEAQIDEIIKRLDEGFSQFKKRCTPLIERHVKDEHMRSVLMNPFELFDLNNGKEERNQERYQRTVLTQGEERRVERIKDIRQFFIGIENRQGFTAGFAPIDRTLHMNPSYNPESIGDNLVVFHEIIHSGQDAGVRQRISSQEAFERYESFHTPGMGKPRVRLDYEASAFLFEIELLNCLLEDELRKSIQSKTPITAEAIAKKMNDQKNIGLYQSLLNMADHYFPLRDTNPQQALENIFAVTQATYTKTFDLYLPTTSGVLKKVN